jgi:subtilase family serine protease
MRYGFRLPLLSTACLFVTSALYAQIPLPVLTGQINNNILVTLTGNTRPEATLDADRGAVPGSLPMNHIFLVLQRSAAQEQALDELIAQLHDRKSPNYHKWLTPDQFGTYGLASSDLMVLSNWLASYGLTVNQIYRNNVTIDFSGTVAQVEAAFHTQIHYFLASGALQLANIADPEIPAALAPVIKGISSLNSFMPHPNYKARSQYTFTNTNGTWEAIVPGDLAAIYNFNPLYAAGYAGTGQTIMVLEDTDVYSTGDWNTFRKTFGLTLKYPHGSFTTVHPSSGGNCTDPGVLVGNDAEAILDAEWASAAAPNAAIVLASCTDTRTQFGGFIAMQNVLNGVGALPGVISISYGESEVRLGASTNASINALYQQAVTLGVSVFVSSGDEGAASTDANKTIATHGISVSGFASTPYNVAVGGTDFGDTYAGSVSTYWSATNGSNYTSALSYIPEIPWNDSCASVLLATKEGYPTTYGTAGFCNSATGEANYLTTASGSGGPSGCATGNNLLRSPGVVSGTCKGYAKPSWQSLIGVPNDGVRDIPDVALFAANGVWGHYYIVCYSDIAGGGASCMGAPSTWAGFGGTSVSTPIMAGIQALVNQKQGSNQGNPNPTYYALAATEYGALGSTACNSTLGNGVSSTCTFYDVTQGDMDVNCTGTNNCYTPSGTNGVLSLSNSAYQPAYGTNVGWDFPTGIGTVNAYNLVMNWP